jgi:glycosyltransferase involved in cell wall biosynthesis
MGGAVRLGIDATNARGGGGVTYLTNLLTAAEPPDCGFDTVVIWCNSDANAKLPERDWLKKVTAEHQNKGLLWRTFWQWRCLSKLYKQERCDILFVPGGSVYANFNKVVTVSQNMLPFDIKQIRHFGFSWMSLKLLLLRFIQSHSFRRSDAIIFLSKYAQTSISRIAKTKNKRSVIIPHGISENFFCHPRKQVPIQGFSRNNPFVILYVSDLFPYKHHQEVIEAFSMLIELGLPVKLDLVGISQEQDRKHIKKILLQNGVAERSFEVRGQIENQRLPSVYHAADLLLFASSCENMPITLLEGMASGLPVASSENGPMPEILQSGAIYFNPNDCFSIYSALEKLITDVHCRERIADVSYHLSESFIWKKAADQTFNLLKEIVDRSGYDQTNDVREKLGSCEF